VQPLAAVLAALAAASACGSGAPGTHVAIELDIPGDDRDGALVGDLDVLQFRVSDGRDFVATQLYRVEDGLPGELILPDVPTGTQVLFDLTGLARDAEIAYGRTCRLAINEAAGSIDARLYFSRVGRFRAGQEPLAPERRDGLMYSDDRGRAIVTGGSQETLVEIFDPRLGSFIDAGDSLARVGGAIAVRGDGTAVLAGGVDGEGGELVAAVEEIDPSSRGDGELIRHLGPESQALAQRTGLAMVALPDGSVLLTGGRSSTGEITDGLATLEEDEGFVPVMRDEAVVGLEQPRTRHSASLGLGGVVYLIGGLSVDELATGEVVTGSIELFRPQDSSIRTQVAALDVPRFGHSATVMPDGRILVVGGKRPRGPEACEAGSGPEVCFEAVSAVEVFDPIAGEVRGVDEGIPGGIHDHTATSVAGGRVLIAGGFDGDGTPRDDAWLFDPQLEALVPTRELTQARARHMATELCDGTVLLVGGESSSDQPLSAERYVPASDRLP
jgi:hypothetical protein